jgi:hypothetical protein
MKNETNETLEQSTATTVVNYILNKTMPYLCASGFLFYECGWMSPLPYFVLSLMWFASHFSFACGYSAAVTDNNFSRMIVGLAEEELDEEDIIETKKNKTK